MPPHRIEVSSALGRYPVVIGSTLLTTLDASLDQVAAKSPRIIISSPTVWSAVRPLFNKVRAAKDPLLVPDGERVKNLATVIRVYEGLLARKADRAYTLVVVGGGVLGDLAGFAAATFLRGLPLVHVPTTLLAQVDSAVGGKVGVNLAAGKNLVGAFYPPRLVVADTDTLSTLPRREFRAGLYEVIKYGAIASESLLTTLETRLPTIFKRDPHTLAAIVTESCRIKAEVVSADEHETGRRRILNFGHTVGHALEAVTKFKRFRHGEAVAYGMLAALAVGVKRQLTPPELERRLAALIATLGPLPPVADLSAKEIVAATRHDKKVVGGTLHFIVVSRPGLTAEVHDVSPKELGVALRAIGVTRP